MIEARSGAGVPVPESATSELQGGRSVVLVPGANPEASFVSLDRALLAHLVPLIELRPGLGARQRIGFGRRLWRTLASRRVALVVVWFGTPGYGSMVAAACRRFRVPLLVMAGGAEVAAVPAAQFGDARRPLRRGLVRRVLESAWVVWAFSESARVEVEALSRPRALRVVPPAVDTAFFTPRPVARDADVITACETISRLTIRQKGLDRMVALARERPGLSFAVAGRVAARDARVRRFVESAPGNVTFCGFVTRERLRDLYARSRVYLQLSAHEGFGVAVVEAMAMGCTPLVSSVPALRALVPSGDLVLPGEGARADALRLDRALAGSYAAPAWGDLNRRFGPDARQRAWAEALGELGLPMVSEKEECC